MGAYRARARCWVAEVGNAHASRKIGDTLAIGKDLFH